MSELSSRLRTSGASSAGPYGYTLTIWGSGMVCSDRLGTPDLGAILLFVAGAVAGFVLVEAAAYGSFRPQPARPQAEVMAIWGSAHLPAAGGAILLVWLLDEIVESTVAWLAAGALATVTYLLLNAVQALLVARASRR